MPSLEVALHNSDKTGHTYETIQSTSFVFSASTSRRHLIVWKYNPSGCVTALRCKTALESLCYSEFSSYYVSFTCF